MSTCTLPDARGRPGGASLGDASPPAGIRDEDADESPAADFETALDAAGNGAFTYAVCCATGITYLAGGVQIGISAYVLPAARCDLGLTSTQMGAINAFFNAGGMISAYMWGVLSDALGRRRVIAVALFADAAATLGATLSQDYASLAAFRFLNGFFVGGPTSLCVLTLCEFTPGRARASYALILGGCYAFAFLMVPGMAWTVLPWRGLPFSSWRALLGLVAVPVLLGALLVLRLPETPKFLVSQGRLADALGVLRSMYAANTGRAAEQYPVRALASPAECAAKPLEAGVLSAGSLRLLIAGARRTASEVVSLVRAPLAARTAMVCALLSLNEFGYFGMVMWLPELLNRFDEYHDLHPNATASVCEMARVVAELPGEPEADGADGPKCAMETINEKVFMETVIISSVCLAAYVVTAPVASRVGRRVLPFCLNVSAGLLAAAVYFVNSSASILVVSSLFQAVVGMANTTVMSIMSDIFPTRVSAVGVCTAILAGRLSMALGNLVMGALVDSRCEVPIFLFSLALIIGGFLCFFVQPRWTSIRPAPKGEMSESNTRPLQPEAPAVRCAAVDEFSAPPASRRFSLNKDKPHRIQIV